MKSYIVNENHIGSAVSEILRYRQTHTNPYIILRMNKKGCCTCCENSINVMPIEKGYCKKLFLPRG